ncbi:MAG: sensor domain-containing phosphodiesterase [Lachnospiraceae bacterium]|nr:sensor domain-containing phosphodiesterase [Lachnospiraceae bacterium]
MRYEEYDSLIMGEENCICYITDLENYDMIHLTKKGMELYNISSPEEYIGQKCYRILQGLEEPCPFCTNKKLIPGEKYCWEHYNEKLNRWMGIEDSLVQIDGKYFRLEHARDITLQKEQWKRLSDQLTVEEILVECVQILASEDNYDTAFQRFLERLGRYYRANRAYIFEFELDKGLIHNTYEWCAANVTAEIDNLQNLPIDCISNWLKKFKETGEFFITSLNQVIDKESEEYKLLVAQGINSLLAAPLYTDNQIVGFIGVDDPTNSTDDLTLLRASSSFVIEELKKRRLIKRLAYVSYTDLLTGVKNRNCYSEVLQKYTAKPPQSLGVIFADVNGMKQINDTYGHKYGDKMLTMVSDILKTVSEDSIYRIGGDEFVILFENIEEDAFQQKSLELKNTFDMDRECDVSLGCAWMDQNPDVNQLIVLADEQMYARKQSYYKKVLENGHQTRVGIASEVLKELKNHQFIVFYQPQINIKTGKITGAEALIRKKGINGELIAPDRFIPYYELEGVIRHIDLFVLESVCQTLNNWKKNDINLKIAVNFSRVTLLEPNIVERIVGVCKKYNVEPSQITLEVTESISKMEHRHLHYLIESLISHGFNLALDDFGSKYSNLSILNELDFDTIKIDKSLVDQLEGCKKSQIIMRNTIRMCKEMDILHTLAEGIETSGQMELLADYDCEYGQGFYFSAPVSLDAFNQMLSEEY